MKRFVLILVLGLLSSVLGVLAYRVTHDKVSVERPEPRLVDLEGHAHRLGELKGKVVVLNFWATWCKPCRDEMKEFSRVQERLSEQGLQFIGIAIDDPGTVKTYLKDFPVSYPIWVGGDDVPPWADSLGNSISALPFTVIFDRDGVKRDVRVGIFPTDPLLKVIVPLLEKNGRQKTPK